MTRKIVKWVVVAVAAVAAAIGGWWHYPYLVLFASMAGDRDWFFGTICLSLILASIYILARRHEAYCLSHVLIASVAVGLVSAGLYILLSSLQPWMAFYRQPPFWMFIVGGGTFGALVSGVTVVQFLRSGACNPGSHDGDFAQTFWADRRRL